MSACGNVCAKLAHSGGPMLIITLLWDPSTIIWEKISFRYFAQRVDRFAHVTNREL
jgi:hypothetical protein